MRRERELGVHGPRLALVSSPLLAYLLRVIRKLGRARDLKQVTTAR
jgi:hypothetical protein